MLVHVGFAISRIDEKEAQEIFSYIDQIGELSELEGDEPFPPGVSPTSPKAVADPPAGEPT